MEQQTPQTLRDLRPGQCARVRAIGRAGEMRRRLREIGLVEDTAVTCLGRSPGSDPAAFLIRGAVFALRLTDCAAITLYPADRGTRP